MGVLDLLRRRPAPQTAAVPMGAVVPGEDGWRDHLPGMGGRAEAAWRVWRDLGEIHFATTFMAREVGRVRFDVEIGDTMLDAEKADEMVAAVSVPDGPGVQSAAMALHAQVAGEFLYARDSDGGWHVLPVSTARKVDQTRGLEGFDVVVGWRRADPADPAKTDSPVLASLKVAHELLALTAASTTQARNRAAARGLLVFPSELEFPEGYSFKDELERNLRAAMDGTAGGPLAQDSPSEMVAGWKFVDMSTQFDQGLVERTEAAIRRLALSMDIPPEVLLGIGDLNHWNAWVSQEDTVRVHVGPLAGVPAWVYARAIEQAAGLERGTVTLTADVAELLRRRPTVADTLQYWDRGLVSDEFARDAIDADAEDAGDGRDRRAVADRLGEDADDRRQEPATAAVAPGQVDRLGDRLAAIDTRLLDTMVGATNVASVRAREKVGAKVRTALRGNGEASGLIDGVDNADVTGVLPIEVWAPTVDAVEVVSAALGPLSDEWVKSVQGAFRSVARLGVEGIEPPDPQGDGEPDGWLRDATALFHAQMTDWVVNNLDRTRAQSTVVPAEQIRRAMSVAGGNGDPLQLAAISGADPIGVAIGRYVLRQLADQGIRERPGQRRWHYGDVFDRPTGPFPPHQDQDGRFVGIDGSSAGWFVGDHEGCRCEIVPAFEEAADAAA